jgi:holo-ACP synthase
MDQLSMSSARLRNSIIIARDRRQELLEVYLKGGYSATVFLSLNIPGEDKNPQGAESLFSRALHGFFTAFPDAGMLARSRDLLGPYAFISLNQDPVGVKRRCIDMESADSFARLIDFDIFNESGCQVGRAALGLPPRSCLVCDLPAVECIRLRRHGAGEVKGRADELLAFCGD